jgi:DNA-directed RNA polymerase specialized sigma subunit
MLHVGNLGPAVEPSDKNILLDRFLGDRRRKLPKLAPDEEHQLIVAAQAGDVGARERLVERFGGWLYSLCEPFRATMDKRDFCDVVAAAAEAFNKAIDKITPSRRNRLSTYAGRVVKTAIYEEVRRIRYGGTAGEGHADRHVAANPKLFRLYETDPAAARAQVIKAVGCKEETAELALQRPSIKFQQFKDEEGDGIFFQRSRKSFDEDKEGDLVPVEIAAKSDQQIIVRSHCAGRIINDVIEQPAKKKAAPDVMVNNGIEVKTDDAPIALNDRWGKPPAEADHATLDLESKRAEREAADAAVAAFAAKGGAITKYSPVERVQRRRSYRPQGLLPRSSVRLEKIPTLGLGDDQIAVLRIIADVCLNKLNNGKCALTPEQLGERAGGVPLARVNKTLQWAQAQDNGLIEIRDDVIFLSKAIEEALKEPGPAWKLIEEERMNRIREELAEDALRNPEFAVAAPVVESKPEPWKLIEAERMRRIRETTLENIDDRLRRDGLQPRKPDAINTEPKKMAA